MVSSNISQHQQPKSLCFAVTLFYIVFSYTGYVSCLVGGGFTFTSILITPHSQLTFILSFHFSSGNGLFNGLNNVYVCCLKNINCRNKVFQVLVESNFLSVFFFFYSPSFWWIQIFRVSFPMKLLQKCGVFQEKCVCVCVCVCDIIVPSYLCMYANPSDLLFICFCFSGSGEHS